jgi:hypothetical protein
VSIRLGESLYTLTVKETRGVMSVDIVRDSTVILRGARIVSGTPLIPYKYLEAGNFAMFTENEEYPTYTQFGVTQSLVYLTAAEIVELRA